MRTICFLTLREKLIIIQRPSPYHICLPVIVVYPLVLGHTRLSGVTVQAHAGAERPLLQQLHDHLLGVKARVLAKGLGDDEHPVSVSLDTEPGAALDSLKELLKGDVGGDLISSGPGDDALVLNRILDGPEPVPDSVLDLGESVLVGTLHQDGHGLGIGALLHVCELVLPEHVLVHDAGLAETLLAELLHLHRQLRLQKAAVLRTVAAAVIRR